MLKKYLSVFNKIIFTEQSKDNTDKHRETSMQKKILSPRIILIVSLFLISLPVQSVVAQIQPDEYEMDDYQELATLIDVGDTENQKHNFHQEGDVDWYQFYALSMNEKFTPYSVEIKNPGARANAVMEFYDSAGNLLFGEPVNDTRAGEEEIFEARFAKAGIYYLKVYQYDSNVYGEDTDYEIRLYHAEMRFKGKFVTVVKDAVTGQPVPSPIVTSSSPDRPPHYGSRSGIVIMSHPAGYDINLTFSANNYETKTESGLSLEETESKRLDTVYLSPASQYTPPAVVSDNLLNINSQITLPPTSAQSQELPQILSIDQDYILTLPRVYIQTQTTESSLNLRAVIRFLANESQNGKIYFEVQELYRLDDNSLDPNYPRFILNTNLLYVPLLTLGNTTITKAVFNLLPGYNPVRFELLNYHID